MPTVDLFPDAEAIASTIMRAGVSGARVYSSIPSKDPEYPLAIVQRTGGSPATPRRLDAADLQIDVWGTSKSEARLLAAQLRKALKEAEGTLVTLSTGATAFVTGMEDILGPTWLPDPVNPPRDRYTFTVRLFLHA